MNQDQPGQDVTYRNIVVFSDGTGNSAAKLFRTNVWRTYQAVDLADPIEKTLPLQYAFYDEGVGTSPLRPLALLGGAIGLGLGRNVRDLYAFLCRTYRPGDKIYAFGFSRGAFTIRVLMGLVLNQGLVQYDGSEDALERDVASAYRRYRKLRYNHTGGLVGPIRSVRDWFIDAWHKKRYGHTYDEVPKVHVPEVEFVGLWDTVDAYGLPIDELTRAVDWAFWPLSMPDQKLNKAVKRAMHALALDDERNTFHPRLWDEEAEEVALVPPDPLARFLRFPVRPFPYFPGEDAEETARESGPERHEGTTSETDTDLPEPLARPRISQVWFAGVHANVGGGYPDDTLSHVPLMWILRGARDAGLRLVPEIVASYAALADENGPIYDSRKGLASYYRYNPRRIAGILEKSGIKLRSINVHQSVFERIKTGLDGYAPMVIPANLKNKDRTAGPELRIITKDERVLPATSYLGCELADLDVLDSRTENVWNFVWRRRFAYFWTLIATLVLASFPVFLSVNPEGSCRSPFCFVAEPIAALGRVLPSFASAWINVFASNPGWFLLALLAVAVGYSRGAGLARRIGDEMRPAWYAFDRLRPARLRAPEQPGLTRFNAAIQWFRLKPFYKAFHFGLTRYALPAVFVVLVLYGGVAIVSRIALTVAESVGSVCRDGEPSRSRFEIRTQARCNALPVFVDAGGVYRIRLVIDEDWKDGPPPLGRNEKIPATPNGLVQNAEPWYLFAGVPLRRHMAQPWFKLMARIGAKGTDVYSLQWRRMDSAAPSTMGAQRSQVWEAVMTARSRGRLFLYVNDATLYPLFAPFLSSNEGAATLVVEPAVGAR